MTLKTQPVRLPSAVSICLSFGSTLFISSQGYRLHKIPMVVAAWP